MVGPGVGSLLGLGAGRVWSGTLVKNRPGNTKGRWLIETIIAY